jgi:hypothetical protein
MGSPNRNLTGEWLRSPADGSGLRKGIVATLPGLLFFTFFYFYLWLYVDLRLIAHVAGMITNFPAFFTGWAFFHEFLAYPGGIVHYLAAFLSQFFHVGWAGAAVATLQAWITCGCTGYLLRRFGLPAARWLRLVPALLLLVTYTQYTYHFVTAVALTVALLFTCLYLVLTGFGQQAGERKPTASVAALAFLVLSLLLYIIDGGAYFVFAALCAIYELLCRRNAYALAYPPVALILPYLVGVWAFSARPRNAYGNLLPFPWETFALQGADTGIMPIYIYYAFVPSLALLGVFWQMLCRARSPASDPQPVRKKTQNPKPRTHTARPRMAALRWALGAAVPILLTAGIVPLARDNTRTALFKTDFYASHEMWSGVLQATRGHRILSLDEPDEIRLACAFDRALYHTGRLGYDLFAWPQSIKALLLTDQTHICDYWRKIDLYLELGHMDLAENALNECIEYFGEQPFILTRLAAINLVKGRVESAQVYLQALRRHLFCRRWAESYLQRLTEDPELRADADIQRMRRLMVREDRVAAISPMNRLLDPLKADPGNKMAFEYLMALCMLARDLDGVAKSFSFIDGLGYKEIPRLYQEALLLHVVRTRKALDLRGFENSPDLQARFRSFNNIIQSHGGPESARGELARRYGDSYFFYHLYPAPGVVR